MEATARGRQMADGHPQLKPAVARREKIIPSTLLFAHETMTAKQYSEKAKKPLGGPAYTDNCNRSVSSNTRDPKALDDDATDEESDGGVGVTALDKEHQSALESVHNPKVKAGRGQQARKISTTLDADDEIIVRMKLEKRTSREIAQALIDAGRVNYSVKTIGSRWKRLRLAMEQARDQELDQQTAVWSVEADDGLLRAIQAADRAIHRMKQEADEQKWKIVAGKLRDFVPTAIYSQNACRERSEYLENGTAIIPVNVDDDPIQHNQELVEAEVLRETKIAEEEILAELANNPAKEANGEARRFRGKLKAKKAAKKQRALEQRALESRTAVFEPRPSRDNIQDLASRDINTPEQLDQLDQSRLPPLQYSRNLSLVTNPTPKILLSDIPISHQITDLSFQAQVITEAERPDPLGSSAHLKDPDLMTRNELRCELKARGLCRGQVKEELLKNVKAARAGATDLKPSPIGRKTNSSGLEQNSMPLRPNHTADTKKTNRKRYIRADSSHNEEPAGKKAKAAVATRTYQPRTHGIAGTTDSTSTTNDMVPWVFDFLDLEKSRLTFVQSFPAQIFQVVSGFEDNQAPHIEYLEPVTSGRRLFLWNFPALASIDYVLNLIGPDFVENISVLGGNSTFIVDMIDCAAAKLTAEAIDGTIVINREAVVENALLAARAHQKALFSGDDANQARAIYGSIDTLLSPILSSIPTTKETDSNCVYVSNVHKLVSSDDLARFLGNTVSCVNIEPGVFLVEFKDVGSTEMALLSSNRLRIYAQPIRVRRYPPEPPKAFHPARVSRLKNFSARDIIDRDYLY